LPMQSSPPTGKKARSFAAVGQERLPLGVVKCVSQPAILGALGGRAGRGSMPASVRAAALGLYLDSI